MWSRKSPPRQPIEANGIDRIMALIYTLDRLDYVVGLDAGGSLLVVGESPPPDEIAESLRVYGDSICYLLASEGS